MTARACVDGEAGCAAICGNRHVRKRRYPFRDWSSQIHWRKGMAERHGTVPIMWSV